MNKNPHIGSSLDDLFEEGGTLEEINLIATKRVIAWRISEAMNKKKLEQDCNGTKNGNKQIIS